MCKLLHIITPDLKGIEVVGRDGIEPPTRGFSVNRSLVKPLFLNDLFSRFSCVQQVYNENFGKFFV